MKVKLSSEGQMEIKGVVRLAPEHQPPEKKQEGKDRLVVTADQFIADSLGTQLAALVKGITTPKWEDCPPGGDCACDCGGSNCACECSDCTGAA